MDIGREDIAAFDDVLADLEDEADEMTLQRALDMHSTLEETGRKLKATISSIYTRVLNLTKEPVRVTGGMAVAQQTGKWRPRPLAEIRRAVVARAAYDQKGERIDSPEEAAARAFDLMAAMYVAPSTVPKTGALEEMGMTKKDVAVWKHTGHELKITPISEVPDDA